MLLRLSKTLIALTLALGASAALSQGRPDLVEQSLRDEAREHVSGQMLVQFRRGVADVDKATALGRINATLVDDVVMTHQRSDGKGDLHLVRLPFGLGVAAAMRGLQNDQTVEFAEPNWIYRTRRRPTTPTTRTARCGACTATPPRRPTSTAARPARPGRPGTRARRPSTSAIIDEGIMFTHPTSPARSGRIPYDRGRRRRQRRQRLHRRHPRLGLRRQQQHDLRRRRSTTTARHVAGTIGAQGRQRARAWSGSAGTSRSSPASSSASSGGTTTNAILALDYFTDLKTRHGLNIVATNNSWGGGGFSQALQDAIERSNQANILFVARRRQRRRSNNDATPSYPASYPNANIIAVASITSTGAISSFSNYGATRSTSARPARRSTRRFRARRAPSSYASYSGTSMAART